jgi:dienelactone hydrolase
MRKRAKAALKELKRNPLVDAEKLASIGYCFGGTTSLELARSGEKLAGVASFHGGLGTPNPKHAKSIKGKVLVLQGGADDFTLAEIPAFEKEMKDAGVDYKIITYKGAKHGFTNPEYKGMKGGVGYDAKADKASWKELKGFLAGIFK